MDGKNILILLQELGLRRIRSRSSWVDAECPYSERHQGGADAHPSFGVKIAVNRSSSYNCQACHVKVDNLLALVWRMSRHPLTAAQHERFSKLATWVIKHDNTLAEASFRKDHDKDPGELAKAKTPSSEKHALYSEYTPPSWANQPARTDGKANHLLFQEPEPTVLAEDDLLPMSVVTPEALEYLQGPKRRLTGETIRAWELGYQRGRVAIPIRDFKQRLVGISGRLIGNGRGPKYLHSLGFRRDYFLYGESKVVEGGTGYVVEGFFDVIRLWQSGYRNAVAIMGSYPSKHQVEKMTKFFTNIVIVPDGDNAGREMALKVMEAVKPFLPVRMVEVPDGRDPDDLTPDELCDRLGPPAFDNRVAV